MTSEWQNEESDGMSDGEVIVDGTFGQICEHGIRFDSVGYNRCVYAKCRRIGNLLLELDKVLKVLEFILEWGKVSEGDGIWLGHSGQLKIEETIESIKKARE